MLCVIVEDLIAELAVNVPVRGEIPVYLVNRHSGFAALRALLFGMPLCSASILLLEKSDVIPNY